MEVAIGTDRIVLKGNNHVIKFPRVSLVKPIKETWHLKQYGKASVVRSWRLSPQIHQSMQWFLLHGISANRREARLAKIQPEIVAVTRTILGGLVNVQPRLKPPEGTDVYDRSTVFYAALGAKDMARLGHTIESEGNFGVTQEGRVVFTDGGSLGLETLVQEQKTSKIVTALAALSLIHNTPSATEPPAAT